MGENDFAVFKNVFNDYYAKDTSKKIRAVIKLRGESGQHISTNPVFGYMKDPNDKKKWIVDDEAAAIVKRIFDMCIGGKGPMQIARVLRAEKVLSVKAYRARQKEKPLPHNPYRWNEQSITEILERMEYLGCTVNFKTYSKSLKFRKRTAVPREDWRVFENTQPAIVDKSQWERVQQLRGNKRRPTKTGITSIFSGLVSCADCGAKLYYHVRDKYSDGRQNHFLCSQYKSNTGSCTLHHIREQILKQQVLECIQYTLHSVKLFKDDFRQEFLQRDEKARKAELAIKRKSLLDTQKRLADLNILVKRVYEDNALGCLSDSQFMLLSNDFEREQRELNELDTKLTIEIEAEARQVADVDRFLKLAEKYANVTELTAPMVNELIDKIVIHKPEKLNGVKHVDVEVFSTYVGQISILAQRENMESIAV